MPLTREDVRHTGFLCLLPTVLFSDVLFFGAGFFHRDLFPYHYPMKRALRAVIESGDFPFWNPFISAGQPMAANPAYEVFYPPQWLILLGDFRFGFVLHIVAHVYLALLGTYFLLRALDVRASVSLFGAVSFGSSGFLLGSMTTLPTFFVWSWAPLVGWALVRLLRQPSPRRFAVAALLAATQMLVGEPISLLQVWALVGCAALLTADRLRSLALCAGLFVATFAIAAVQVVPAIDHAHDSARARGFPYAQVVDYSMPLIRPLEMVIPRLFAMLDIRKNLVWDARAFSHETPYLLSVYVGVGIVILALAGIFAGTRGRFMLIAVSSGSYLLAIGGKTPLYRWLYELGIARSLRYPEKFAASAIFAALLFGALVGERLMAGDERVRRAVRWCAVGAVLTCAAVLLLWQFPAQSTRLIPVARSYWLLGLLLTASWAALGFLGKHAESRAWKLGALLVLLGDVVMLAREVSPSLPGDFFTPPPVARSLDPRPDAYAVFNRGDWRPLDEKLMATRALPHWWAVRNSLQPMTAPAWGFRSVLERDFDETALLPTHDLLDLMMRVGNGGAARWAEPFMLRSNARYLLDYRPVEQDRAALAGDPLESLPVSITDFGASGRYTFAAALIEAHTDAELQRAFVTTQATVVPFAPFALASARVTATRETSSTATLDVESSGQAFLVAAVTRHKYWRATIDGRDAPLLPANVAYQGLVVPAGRHRIELRYRNPLVVWGGVFSLLALLSACAVAVWPRRARTPDQRDATRLS
ncbi:MAG: hypothetical protein ABIT01_13995 [Thermoanaerobaculia bacterium]